MLTLGLRCGSRSSLVTSSKSSNKDGNDGSKSRQKVRAGLERGNAWGAAGAKAGAGRVAACAKRAPCVASLCTAVTLAKWGERAGKVAISTAMGPTRVELGNSLGEQSSGEKRPGKACRDIPALWDES